MGLISRGLVLPLAVMLLATACAGSCGGDDDNTPSTPAPPAASTAQLGPTSTSPAPPGPTSTPAPGAAIGKITFVKPIPVYVDDAEVDLGAALHEQDHIDTMDRPGLKGGQGSFSLKVGIQRCDVSRNTSLRIAPEPGTLVQFEAGTIWCETTKSGDKGFYIYTGDARTTVTATDPVFGVTIEADRTVVRVADGEVEVFRPGMEKPVPVGAGEQLAVPNSGPVPTKPEPFSLTQLSPDEQQSVNEMLKDTLAPTATVPTGRTPGPATATVPSGATPSPTSLPVTIRHLFVLKDGEVAPDLIQQWEASDDGIAITLTLAPDVVRPDGRPFNADDVAALIKEHAADDLLRFNIQAVNVVDDRTVEVVLGHPDPDNFLQALTAYPIEVVAQEIPG